MMHAKTLVVDGVWSMFGSANFDNRSLELNDELNVAVSEPRLAARLLQDFEQDLVLAPPRPRRPGAAARAEKARETLLERTSARSSDRSSASGD